MTRRVLAAKINGSLGGIAGAKNLTPEQREQRARAGGLAILDLFGKDYYASLKKNALPKKSAVQEPVKISTAARRIAAMCM